MSASAGHKNSTTSAPEGEVTQGDSRAGRRSVVAIGLAAALVASGGVSGLVLVSQDEPNGTPAAPIASSSPAPIVPVTRAATSAESRSRSSGWISTSAAGKRSSTFPSSMT